MRASIHFTDFDDRYFPDVSTEEDTSTGIHDSYDDSKAYNLRTAVLMFVTVVKAGKGTAILEAVREAYNPLYKEMLAKTQGAGLQ